MSDPMSSHQIEDVLSSIRRLVSDDLRPKSRAVPVPELVDKLLLTPALRVVTTSLPPQDDVSDGAQDSPIALEHGDVAADRMAGAIAAWQDDDTDDDACDTAEVAETAMASTPPAGESSGIVAAFGAAEKTGGTDDEDAGASAKAMPNATFIRHHGDLARREEVLVSLSREPALEAPEPLAVTLLGADSAEAPPGAVPEPDLAVVDAEPAVAPSLLDGGALAALKEDRAQPDGPAPGQPVELEIAPHSGPAVVFRSRRDGDAPIVDPAADQSVAETQSDAADDTGVVVGLVPDVPVADHTALVPAELPQPDVADVKVEVEPHLFRTPGTVGGDAPPPQPIPGADSIEEAVLLQIVQQMIRAELQGALGERITRNVRKLVRTEIQRVLTARDLD